MKYSYTYYDINTNIHKSEIQFNTDGNITYEDGKTTSSSTSSSYYSSKTAYTATQAANKLAELKTTL